MAKFPKNSSSVPLLIILLALVFCACEVYAKQNVLDQDDVVLVDSLNTNRICFHRNMSLIDSSYHTTIVKQIKAAIDSISKIIKVQDVEFRVLVFPERTIPRLGMSGAAPNKSQIYLLLDPNNPKVYDSINHSIVATLAHEYHHTLRYRTVGFGNNLFEAMISEGLADHFALQVTQLDTLPWTSEISDKERSYWKAEAEKMWFKPEYDYLAWFVGINTKIPRGTGYVIGFEIVEDYLNKHPDETAATLYDAPAEIFLR